MSMNRIASIGLFLLGIAALGWVGLLWSEHIVKQPQRDRGYVQKKNFFDQFSFDEVRQFDLFYEQYLNTQFTIPGAYQSIEWLNLKRSSIEDYQFRDKFEDAVKKLMVNSYTSLVEAYEAKLDAVKKIGSDSTVSMASDVARARTKGDMSALHYLWALLAYEKVLDRTGRRNVELGNLINKYRQVTGWNGRITIDE